MSISWDKLVLSSTVRCLNIPSWSWSRLDLLFSSRPVPATRYSGVRKAAARSCRRDAPDPCRQRGAGGQWAAQGLPPRLPSRCCTVSFADAGSPAGCACPRPPRDWAARHCPGGGGLSALPARPAAQRAAAVSLSLSCPWQPSCLFSFWGSAWVSSGYWSGRSPMPRWHFSPLSWCEGWRVFSLSCEPLPSETNSDRSCERGAKMRHWIKTRGTSLGRTLTWQNTSGYTVEGSWRAKGSSLV